MQPSTIVVVEGILPTDADDTNLKDECLSFALDQRAFGPRRLLVAFADQSGRFLGLAHAPRTEPADLALACCVDYLGDGAAAAVAFCDEPVADGPPPDDLGERFAVARAVCAQHGIHLVDWFSCDDQLFRSTRLALEPDGEWWDVPYGHIG
jgi:hypothetical protein